MCRGEPVRGGSSHYGVHIFSHGDTEDRSLIAVFWRSGDHDSRKFEFAPESEDLEAPLLFRGGGLVFSTESRGPGAGPHCAAQCFQRDR